MNRRLRLVSRAAFALSLLVSAGVATGRPQEAARAQMDRPARRDFLLPELVRSGSAAARKLSDLQVTKHLVLYFFSEQCGVTFYYKSRIQGLQKAFESRGFQFVGVRSGKHEPGSTPPELTYLRMPFVDDAAGELVRYFDVKQSVTFVVLDPAGNLRYRGGFDDNVDEKQVKKPYLRNALQKLASGKPVTVKQGEAIGCAILPVQ